MKRLFTLLILLALAVPFTAQRAEAQFSLIPYLGYNTEDGLGPLIGIGAEFDAPNLGGLTLSIQPGIEYVFTDGDGVDYLQLDGNVIARFGAPGASILPYAGAGLGVAFVSYDIGDDSETETELGLNLLGGIIFPGAFGFGNPYLQARYSLIDPFEAFSIMGGIRIPLGAR